MNEFLYYWTVDGKRKVRVGRAIVCLLIITIGFVVTISSWNSSDSNKENIRANDINYSAYYTWQTTRSDETWASYDVMISDNFDWNDATLTDQGRLAEEVVEIAREKAAADGLGSSYGTMGWTSDNNLAFSWGTDHRSTIKIYNDGIYDCDWRI